MARDISKSTGNRLEIGTTFNQVGPLIGSAAAVSFHCWAQFDVLGTGTFDNNLFSWGMGAGLGAVNPCIGGSPAKLRFGGRSQNADAFQQGVGSTTIATGTWYSCGGVLDFTNDKIRVYLNGFEEVNSTVTFGASNYTHTAASSGRDRIGANAGTISTANQVDGRITQLAFWNVDIGGEAFVSLAKGFNPLMFTKPLLYFPLSGRQSPELDVMNGLVGTITGTMTAFDNPSMLIVPTKRAWAKSTIINLDVDFSLYNEWLLGLVKDNAGATENLKAIEETDLLTNLIAYYPFESASPGNDVHSTLDATVTGSTTATAGINGNSVTVTSGVGNQIRYTGSTTPFNTVSNTLSFWTYIPSGHTGEDLIQYASTTGSGVRINIGFGTNIIRLYTSAGSFLGGHSYSFSADTWYHVVVDLTKSGSDTTATTWINGVLVGTMNLVGYVMESGSGTATLNLGGLSTSNQFDGRLDELAWYAGTTGFTIDKAKCIYNGGAGRFYSNFLAGPFSEGKTVVTNTEAKLNLNLDKVVNEEGLLAVSNITTNPLDDIKAYWPMNETSGNRVDTITGKLLTEVNGPVTSTTGMNGNAANLTDTQGFSNNFGGDNFSGERTIAFWIKSPDIAGTTTLWNFPVSSWNVNLIQSIAPGNLYLQTSSGGFGVVPSNTWTHIIISVRQGSSSTMYINGSSYSTFSTGSEIAYTETSMEIPGSTYTSLLLDEVMVWRRGITDAEAAEVYNSGTVKTPPFTVVGDIFNTENLAASLTTPVNADGLTNVENLLKLDIDKIVNREGLLALAIDKVVNEENLLALAIDKVVNKENLLALAIDAVTNKENLLALAIDKVVGDEVVLTLAIDKVVNDEALLALAIDKVVNKENLLALAQDGVVPKEGLLALLIDKIVNDEYLLALNKDNVAVDENLLGLNKDTPVADENLLTLNNDNIVNDEYAVLLNLDKVVNDENLLGLNKDNAAADENLLGLNKDNAAGDEYLLGLQKDNAGADEYLLGLSIDKVVNTENALFLDLDKVVVYEQTLALSNNGVVADESLLGASADAQAADEYLLGINADGILNVEKLAVGTVSLDVDGPLPYEALVNLNLDNSTNNENLLLLNSDRVVNRENVLGVYADSPENVEYLKGLNLDGAFGNEVLLTVAANATVNLENCLLINLDARTNLEQLVFLALDKGVALENLLLLSRDVVTNTESILSLNQDASTNLEWSTPIDINAPLNTEQLGLIILDKVVNTEFLAGVFQNHTTENEHLLQINSDAQLYVYNISEIAVDGVIPVEYKGSIYITAETALEYLLSVDMAETAEYEQLLKVNSDVLVNLEHFSEDVVAGVEVFLLAHRNKVWVLRSREKELRLPARYVLFNFANRENTLPLPPRTRTWTLRR
jgi:hypothetical protein